MKKGFTLIELLVVVAIIGLLASVVVVSLGGARSGARDARRAADISQLHIALELYASNNSGTFPASQAVLATELVPTYIAALPTDPTETDYSYCRGTSIREYAMGITLENAGSDIMKSSITTLPTGCILSPVFPDSGACDGPTGDGYCVRN